MVELPLADFLLIHSTGIWLLFPEQRRRFEWLRAGPSWYLSHHTLGLIHVKQARPVNSLITEVQHFITQKAESLLLKKELETQRNGRFEQGRLQMSDGFVSEANMILTSH